MTVLEKTRKFLRKEKCLVAFENNVIKQKNITLKTLIKIQEFPNNNVANVISNAFFGIRH